MSGQAGVCTLVIILATCTEMTTDDNKINWDLGNIVCHPPCPIGVTTYLHKLSTPQMLKCDKNFGMILNVQIYTSYFTSKRSGKLGRDSFTKKQLLWHISCFIYIEFKSLK